MEIMEIKALGNERIAIITPYNPDFVACVKQAGARWDAERKAWTADERAIEAVRACMVRVYGRDDRPAETVTVRVTVGESRIRADRGPIVLFGRTVASASGRDSGTRVGDGVSFLAGKADSGGSAKNWETRIFPGSVIEIRDVPRAAVENRLGWKDSYGAFEVVEPADPLAGLKAEREAILRRLAEIDEILGKEA